MEGDDGGGNEFDLANLGLRLLGSPVPPCWSNGVQRIVDSMAPMVDLLLLQLHCITATVLLCRSRDRSCVDRAAINYFTTLRSCSEALNLPLVVKFIELQCA